MGNFLSGNTSGDQEISSYPTDVTLGDQSVLPTYLGLFRVRRGYKRVDRGISFALVQPRRNLNNDKLALQSNVGSVSTDTGAVLLLSQSAPCVLPRFGL